MSEEIIMFGDTEAKKHKFHQFIRCKDDFEKNILLCIMLPTTSAYRRYINDLTLSPDTMKNI